MKMALIVLTSCALIARLAQRPRTTPEQAFWTWFESNEAALFDFEADQERIFDQIGTELHKIDPALTFEFGPKSNGRREFVISADGIRSAFPKVEALYAAAPTLPRWKFIKFRPRRTAADIAYGGVSVKAQSVLVAVEPAGSKVNITIFIPGYTTAAYKTYMAITFLLLDQALGEYDVEMRVANIEIKPASEAPVTAHPLEALPKVVDSMLSTKRTQ
jgi:hypothetical protein